MNDWDKMLALATAYDYLRAERSELSRLSMERRQAIGCTEETLAVMQASIEDLEYSLNRAMQAIGEGGIWRWKIQMHAELVGPHLADYLRKRFSSDAPTA